jgi:hypothetical protein
MGTKTLSRGATFAFGSGFGFEPIMFQKDNGSLAVQRAAVFRSGTFRDSMGIQNTWEKIHMDQMIQNYKHLNDNGIFTDIPVRDGHSGWLIHNMPGNGNVIGYHSNLWTENLTAPHDGQNYDYILADFEITDPQGAQKILNGTFRNRSAEINTYLTNNEAEFWPVYMGVAYVDIPAVEGLKFSSSSTPADDRQVYVFMDNKETGVATESTTAGQATGTPAAPALLGVTPTAQAFSINGQVSTDPAAVQNHITALEKFRAETADANRANFVTQLAKDGKILATQVDGLTAFAKTLGDEQYVAWCATYEAAPVNSLTANHGGGATNTGNAAETQATAADKQVDVDLEVVAMHKRAGTPVDQIKAGASYTRLVAAGKAPVL